MTFSTNQINSCRFTTLQGIIYEIEFGGRPGPAVNIPERKVTSLIAGKLKTLSTVTSRSLSAGKD